MEEMSLVLHCPGSAKNMYFLLVSQTSVMNRDAQYGTFSANSYNYKANMDKITDMFTLVFITCTLCTPEGKKS